MQLKVSGPGLFTNYPASFGSTHTTHRYIAMAGNVSEMLRNCEKVLCKGVRVGTYSRNQFREWPRVENNSYCGYCDINLFLN